ncbi:MAG: outer membrane protein assembly factor BamD [Candidatus Cardinium sp.]|uniref:outer membrane protein assembly factor BamD n=1 Tax=Cardinium endosymbiont of Dermatophagoides farinae TaxID=2597823 RepID=UPI001183AC21|nr:outer membrane protein assembly factor BamD [Cardinium endosymbiont of Dermatophagoides farinae]TSJ80721.1 outer membrane protein assembly factor BamD [Cardinium endosymbiont of Dermatophagoides farinae]UWW96719.1 MAG: outer membrane protein assembly factor BamD [Candidatus Cardinium sp.]
MKNYLIHLCYRFRWLFLLPFALVGDTLFAATPDHKAQALVSQKKEEVVRLYNRKRYARASAQIEELLPLLKSRTDRREFELYQAYCNFYEKKYLVSANQFHLFVKQYPTSLQAEEALFMRGYSLACQDVDIRLDQTTTRSAIHWLDRYLELYPTGVYLDKAFDALQNLQERLMQKDFQAAALYVRLGCYKAAIITLKNFEEKYPDSSFKEKVLQLLIKCAKQLAMRASNEEKQKEAIGGWKLQDYLHSKGINDGGNIVEKIKKMEENKKSKESKEKSTCWITNLFG